MSEICVYTPKVSEEAREDFKALLKNKIFAAIKLGAPLAVNLSNFYDRQFGWYYNNSGAALGAVLSSFDIAPAEAESRRKKMKAEFIAHLRGDIDYELANYKSSSCSFKLQSDTIIITPKEYKSDDAYAKLAENLKKAGFIVANRAKHVLRVKQEDGRLEAIVDLSGNNKVKGFYFILSGDEPDYLPYTDSLSGVKALQAFLKAVEPLMENE